LVRAADFLGSSELLESAERLAEAFTPELTATDQRFDVIWGSAGALLGLLALDGAGGAGALRRAEECAAHLLAHRTADPESGLRAWSTLRAVPSSGFAHGACGIAHALLRLYRRTGATELYDAALEAFAFERTLYREDLLNWRDSPDEADRQPILLGWCHGAPGIGLSRLAALDHLRAGDEPAIAQDLHRALTATLALQAPGTDTICCGYFGRIELLIESGLCLGNPALTARAVRLAGERLARAAELGFELTAEEGTPAPLQPGFWQSLGGTAYTLLRLTDPRRFPCVLAMV
jgi:lantibiotic modifying enzyme